MPQAPTEDLADLYENAPCGYLSLGPDGRIVKSNLTLTTWLGYEAGALIGKRLRELLNVSGQMFYETHFAPLLRMQGFFNEVALDLLRADGSTMQVLANAAERRGASGELMFTRVTLIPATERRRYERELVAAKETAQAARSLAEGRLLEEHETAELREQFIAVLGHDLRNPLAAIDGGINILQQEPQTEKSLRVLKLLRGSVDRMSNLIDNILDFARGRLGGGLTIDRVALPLEATLEQVLAELRATHPDRVIELASALPMPIAADHPRLAQLVSNLLANAITHGAGDQPVRVAARLVEGELELSVANGGKPIEADAMDRLFQPFSRGSSGSRVQGLGLGLYISDQIAKAHGGRIEVASDEAETRFVLRMPVDGGQA